MSDLRQCSLHSTQEVLLAETAEQAKCGHNEVELASLVKGSLLSPA